ncbi:MAG: MMPL family transporter [Actinobacteria bacterium]|nr:MMPL family transporter [Actinomycetota bacterium]
MSQPRRPKFLALSIVIAIAWFAVGGVLGPLSGKLSDVQSNSNSEFLPANSETTVVSAKLEKFSAKSGAANVVPMTIVFERQNGTFSVADQPVIAELITSISELELVSKFVATVDFNGVQVPSVFPATPEQFLQAVSPDGKAFVLNVNFDAAKLIDGQGAFEVIGDLVDDVQALVDDSGLNADGYVTGAVGIFAEFAKAFAGIDTQLLLTTLIVVALILVVVYRSPILWFIPLLSALFSLTLASGMVYYLAYNDIIKLNGQSQGILSVLVLGASTDYALLLISRYREELRHDEDKYHAMKAAWLGTWEPIAASAGTVAIGLLCLQLSELKSNAGLGPVGAVGIIAALVVTLTFLPAFLVLFGRRVFWPFVPKFGSELVETKGMWGKVAKFVGRNARKAWIVSTAVLLVMAYGMTSLQADGVSDVDVFTNRDAKPLVGIQVLEEHGLVPPSVDATVITNADKSAEVLQAINSSVGTSSAIQRSTFTATGPVRLVVDGIAAFDVTFKVTEDSALQQEYVRDLRIIVHEVDGADALVGGTAAANFDVQESSRRDRIVIIPIILLVITLILMLLLRSILAPILLIATVVLSFGATMGASAFVFNNIFKFPGADASYPLFTFVFLVALGIDYNIFLMTRVREESLKLGTHEGILKALAVTGGVITSAGVILAATFAVLGILPLVFLAELGFAVAFGVLLDTMLVRSILVPALSYDIGKKIWWPSKLAKAND